ncbi:MAG: DUF3179 domain-containing protein, partial [Chloroflexota bacterium]
SRPDHTRDQPVLVPPPPEVDPALIDDLLPRGIIEAIDDPQFQTIDEVDPDMEPDERLIGVSINGDVRAYPINILSSHEIVNDIVGGEPIAVTWCPLCFSALVFSRNLQGRDEPLTFGVTGSLLYETLVMYDRQTDSRWSQLYGASVDGSLAGERLSFFPSVLSEWHAWREQYPEGLVLSKQLTCAQFNCGTYATNPRGSYGIDPYEGYYNSGDQGVLSGILPPDEGQTSYQSKERVLGIRLAGVERAYPFKSLDEQGLLNDELSGQPVVIYFDPESSAGTAYLRRLGQVTLTFQRSPESADILIDDQTGSQWSALTGTAISGEYRGERLSPLVSTPAFAFGWYSYFPQSETYGD